MVTDDVWRDRLTLGIAGIVTVVCVAGDLVLGILNRPPSAFLLTAGTVAFTVIAGYGKAGFNQFRQRRSGHDDAVSAKPPEPNGLVKGEKPCSPDSSRS